VNTVVLIKTYLNLCFAQSRRLLINQHTYLHECLVKRLVPVINDHHEDVDYIFWLDCASAHYAKTVVSWMDENINYVARHMNPPNVPQARPIESFWGCLAHPLVFSNLL
jgi:hypothetical protein